MTDDGAFTADFTQLHASWVAADPQSGLVAYEYTIGTTPTGSQLVAPTLLPGTQTALTQTGLTLQQAQRYYLAVRAQNATGTWGPWGVSDGIYANQTAPVLTTILPAAGSTVLAGDTVVLSATASDLDGDALAFQFSLNGVIHQPWSASAQHAWVPLESEFGLTAIRIEVRDPYGGVDAGTSRVFVLHRPISPPSP